MKYEILTLFLVICSVYGQGMIDVNGKNETIPEISTIIPGPITTSNSSNITTTSTTPIPPTTSKTTNVTTTTTTPTTSTTPTTPTTSTTPKTKPTTPTTPSSTTSSTSSTVAPTKSTSVKPPTSTSAPSNDRKFDGPSFVGGIVLTVGLVAIGFVAFKFYKARTELNYHTL